MGEGETDSEGDSDMVFKNAVLFLRDALISREFSDAVKAGDSGRVVLVLKVWALSFRGNGRTKYAHEMLHLIHNLSSVWSPAIRYVSKSLSSHSRLYFICFSRDIVLNNWLLNPTGNPNSWVEIDLMQEHLNYWIKVSIKLTSECLFTWSWFRSSTKPMDPMHPGSGLSQLHHVSMFFGSYQRALMTY